MTVVVPLTAPTVAVTTTVPGATAVPAPPFATEKTPASLEIHVAVVVTSATEPSEYVAVARSASVTPAPTTGDVGVTAIETSVAGVTVSVAVPATPASAARMVVVPGPTPRARPVAEMVATAVLVELHVTEVVTSWCVPSLSVATAV
jgi:hypothetical protein